MREAPTGMTRKVRNFSWCFVWLLPLVWGLTTYVAVYYPGDEYGLWAVGGLAGIWVYAIVGDLGTVWKLLPFVLAAGGICMSVVGLMLDLLRAPHRRTFVLWLAISIFVCVTTIASYPSYERAVSKNGSLQAYLFFSSNIGLYLTCIIMLLVMSVWRLTHRRPPPGHCQICGYDLTGNTTGVCSECGETI